MASVQAADRARIPFRQRGTSASPCRSHAWVAKKRASPLAPGWLDARPKGRHRRELDALPGAKHLPPEKAGKPKLVALHSQFSATLHAPAF
ncbi:hypothetical protein MRX96_036453 [Rhipicephalus microplus]